jgi:biopolymer transport protein TolR
MKSKSITPEINVTPFVDVVLVLLIIFMVVTPAIANEDRVALPEADHPDPKAEGEVKPWEVVLGQDGRFVIDDAPIEAPALKAELERRKAADPSRKVLLLADGRLAYGTVRGAFSMLQGVGFRGVSLKVLEKEKPAGEGG